MRNDKARDAMKPNKYVELIAVVERFKNDIVHSQRRERQRKNIPKMNPPCVLTQIRKISGYKKYQGSVRWREIKKTQMHNANIREEKMAGLTVGV
jgi:hypothetical protein